MNYKSLLETKNDEEQSSSKRNLNYPYFPSNSVSEKAVTSQINLVLYYISTNLDWEMSVENIYQEYAAKCDNDLFRYYENLQNYKEINQDFEGEHSVWSDNTSLDMLPDFTLDKDDIEFGGIMEEYKNAQNLIAKVKLLCNKIQFVDNRRSEISSGILERILRDFADGYEKGIVEYRVEIMRYFKHEFERPLKTFIIKKMIARKGFNVQEYGKSAIDYFLETIGILVNDHFTRQRCDEILKILFAEPNNNVDGHSNSIELEDRKLKWLCTPAEFGFLIQELIGKNWLKRPSTSFKKDAAFYMKTFNISGKVQTVEKEISTTQNSLSNNSRSRIKIPFNDKKVV